MIGCANLKCKGFCMLKGLAISPGYALGKAYCLKHFQLDNVPARSIGAGEIEAEIARFSYAIQLARDEISQLTRLPQIRNSLEISNIFNAHLTLVDDPDLKKEVVKRIRERQLNVEAVVSGVAKDYSDFFRSLPDPQFQEKAVDVMDIGRRILKNCQDKMHMPGFSDLKEGVIVIAEDLTASDIVSFDTTKVLGLATAEGTATSHAAILARSLGIPALVQVKNLIQVVEQGEFIILDGNTGTLVIKPLNDVVEEYRVAHAAFESRKADYRATLTQPSVTKDDVKIRLCANIGQPQDVDAVITNGADGIGLYRTEFTYLIRRRFPTEDELVDIYWDVVQRLDGAEVVIRTIDLGGDKISHLVGHVGEKNPEMGWRAVRMSLDRLDIFRTQLRAIIRVCARCDHGNVKILFPMISNLGELRRSKTFLGEVRAELASEGIVVENKIPIGAMIEVPSAAILADKIAREVDFLSIGSNDLVQYTLAVDRTNSKVAHLYQPTNPAVLKLLHDVIVAGETRECPVSLCGELAGDGRYTLLLIGLGLRALSMNAIFIPRVKHAILSLSIAEIRPQVMAMLELDTAEEIDTALSKLNAHYGLS
ncbi:MAG: phosphoenolpyruvate--protein phosphotransferase [Candidatus Riflebacteria bacterium]|nr:phosphoenolpyruvate--protein phosphotransferase [Candidatus Riflebacteria bacterium]